MRSFDTLFRGFSISFVLGMFVMGLLCLVLPNEPVQLLKKIAGNQRIVAGSDDGGFAALFFPAPTAFLVVALLPIYGLMAELVKRAS